MFRIVPELPEWGNLRCCRTLGAADANFDLDFLHVHSLLTSRSAMSASRALPLTAANGRYFRNSARSNIQSLIATLFLSALVVHLLKPVVALVVTPINEDGSMIDTGTILAPSFETDMVGG